jgi:hypothetical protein
MQQFAYHRWTGGADAPAEPLVWTRPVRRSQNQVALGKSSKRLSRYEKLSLLMMSLAWGLTIAIVTVLHFGNYHLETRTSSTSGAHKEFYLENTITPPINPSQGEGGSR